MASIRSSKGRIPIKSKEDLQNVEKGSRLEVVRRAYSHWAIYTGNGKVCHKVQDRRDPRNGPAALSAATSGNLPVVICEDDIEKLFQKGATVYVNNSADSKMKPYSPDEIVKRARSKKGKADYSILRQNCEHFANWCRYGESKSEQVAIPVKAAGLATAAAAVIAVVATGVGFIAMAMLSGGKKRQQ